jgi:hypothetical protein
MPKGDFMKAFQAFKKETGAKITRTEFAVIYNDLHNKKPKKETLIEDDEKIEGVLI